MVFVDPMPPRLKVAYVLALLAALVVVQAHAQWRQWAAGYRPFAHAPGRVPYSWDMFAIRMDRCAIRWDPPLRVEGQPVATWEDREPPLEFDTVYDHVGDYEGAARGACRFRNARATTTTLTCAVSEGRVLEHAFACP